MLKIFLLLFMFLPVGICADHWVIIANSPEFCIESIQKNLASKKILALDGAANFLKTYNITPDVILGDFDSIQDKHFWGVEEMFNQINENSMPYLGHFGVTIVPAKNQDLTDLEKGILFCDSHKAESITILNATGGRFDHTLGNIGFLKKYHLPSRPLCIISGDEKIEFVRDATICIQGEIGSACGIIGFPEAVMTTQGLKYNGQGYTLKLGFQESICNTLDSETASISIQGDALVIHKI